MSFKTKTIIVCTIICSYGIIADSQCCAMYRTPAQKAELRKRYLRDEYNAHKLLNDRDNDILWLQRFQPTIIRYEFATPAEIDALISGQPTSSTSSTASTNDVSDRPEQQQQPRQNSSSTVSAAVTPQSPSRVQEPVQQTKPQAQNNISQPQIQQPQQPAPAESIAPAQPERLQTVDEQTKNAINLRMQQREIQAARDAQYTAHLMTELNEAENRGDLEWLKQHRQLLIQKNPALESRVDELIGALEHSNTLNVQQPAQTGQEDRGQEELDTREDREVTGIYREDAVKEMQSAHTEQGAAAALVRLYKNLTANCGENYTRHYALLDQLLQSYSVTEINAELAGLRRIPEINALIGNEIAMLSNHMLYRLWLTEITPDSAYAAFQQAATNNDHNAMINLYRDFLKNTGDAESVLEQVLELFYAAVNKNDATAIFDLYRHFLKESVCEKRALLRLYVHIISGAARAEIWGVIALCFVGSEYADEILSMIARQQQTQATVFTEELANQYEEYRAAIVNGDHAKIIDLGNHLVETCVIDRETYAAVVHSIINYQQPYPVEATQPLPTIMPAPDQELSPEDALAIQMALAQNE